MTIQRNPEDGLFGMGHDEIVQWLMEEHSMLTKSEVANCFLASLSTRNRMWRAVLGHYSIFQHLKRHEFTPCEAFPTDPRCAICRLRPDVEIDHDLLREKVEISHFDRSDYPEYAATCFSILRETGTPIPCENDRSIFSNLINTIRSLGSEATLSSLNQAIKGTLKSNKRERSILLQILGYAGILCPSNQKSYLNEYVGYERRSLLQPAHFFKRDSSYPLRFWQGSDGVNSDAVEFWFGNLID